MQYQADNIAECALAFSIPHHIATVCISAHSNIFLSVKIETFNGCINFYILNRPVSYIISCKSIARVYRNSRISPFRTEFLNGRVDTVAIPNKDIIALFTDGGNATLYIRIQGFDVLCTRDKNLHPNSFPLTVFRLCNRQKIYITHKGISSKDSNTLSRS